MQILVCEVERSRVFRVISQSVVRSPVAEVPEAWSVLYRLRWYSHRRRSQCRRSVSASVPVRPVPAAVQYSDDLGL